MDTTQTIRIPIPAGRSRHSPLDHAHALAMVLRNEFGIGFVFHHAATGGLVEPREARDEGEELMSQTMVLPVDAPLSADMACRHAEDGHPSVVALAPGQYRVVVVLTQFGKPLFVAVGLFQGLARTRPEADRERGWMQQWAQSFSDRLRLNDQFLSQKLSTEEQMSHAKGAWEGLLGLDHVMRRLRIHKDPEKYQLRILQTAFNLLHVQALVCVPPDHQSLVMMQGETTLSGVDCRHLAALLEKSPDYRGSGPIFCNQLASLPWAMSFPSLSTVLAFPMTDSEPRGWVIALNKRPPEDDGTRGALPFRRSDAALLTPFVSLLRLHASAVGRYHDLKELMVGLARSLTAAIDAKDSYTFGHSERVARIAVELGDAMGLRGDELNNLYLAGLLHDVGKIGVPDAVLRKPGKLTEDEFDQVKQHVTLGYSILADLKPIRNLLPGVLYHHERYDGKGYPEGLVGQNIPQLARILAVADAFDAMSTNCPYRQSLLAEEIEARLQQGAGSQWDPQVVEAFFRVKHKVHAIQRRGVGESLRHALDGALQNKGSTFIL